MKRLSLFLTSALLLVLANACQHETDIQPEPSPFITMTVDAGAAGTKTAVQVDGSTYNVTWKAGDRITIAEIINGNSEHRKEGLHIEQLATSDPLTADATSASFNVTLDNRSSAAYNPEGDVFRYVGVYPASELYVLWTGDNRSEWEAHWGNTTTPDHATVIVGLPTDQRPSATSFDPAADLMVSNMVTSASQPGSLSLQFARVGTIAQITLKGLPAGTQLTHGEFTFPQTQTWPGAYMMEYDPVLGKTGIFTKSSGLITFEPEDVYVNGDGEAVLWLRTLSGTLSRWFKFDVTVSDGGKGGGETERYEKRVDLDALSKTINFPESGLTKFSVTLEKHYDLVMAMETYDATETSLTLNMHYDLAGKEPLSSVSYGLISFDPSVIAPEDIFIATAVAPEDVIYLVPDGDGRVSYELTGLTPNTTYNFMPFIVIDGTEYHPSSSYLSPSTLVHYDYPVPTAVDLGLPSGTKWASFNLGSDAALTAGYYFKWGEVRPTVDFNGSYSSKYWGDQYNTSVAGRASKYSTNAANGVDDLVNVEKTILDAADDAATVNLGDGWRTPTNADFEELINNCTVTPTAGGFVFTSNINSNSITFPDCGFYNGDEKGSDTRMMTSSLDAYSYNSHNSAYYVQISNLLTPEVTASLSTPEGLTRGFWKFNIRPVKGGTPSGHIWKVHCAVSEITSTSARVTGHFLFGEDPTNYYYFYKAHIYTKRQPQNSDITEQSITNRGTGEYGYYDFVGLTPGTTYYYFVSCDRQNKINSGHDYYYSEVRSFVAE